MQLTNRNVKRKNQLCYEKKEYGFKMLKKQKLLACAAGDLRATNSMDG